MSHYLNFVSPKPFERKMADIWNAKHIAAAKNIAEYGGIQSAPAALLEREEDALRHLFYWEARINAYKKIDLGAEMAKYEPSRPTE